MSWGDWGVEGGYSKPVTPRPKNIKYSGGNKPARKGCSFVIAVPVLVVLLVCLGYQIL